jgi:glycolate oxidase FAD binding subunit
MTAHLRSALADLVSPGTLLPEAESANWTAGGGTPAAVVAPPSEEEVGKVLDRASREGWKVLPAGFGRWLAGGGPVEADVVLSTRRIRGVTEYEPADLTFTAGAGISLSSLASATGAHGQWLPLDPPGGEEGSLGAAVATGVGGPLRQWYGAPRDHALGLTVVAGDGRVLRWGGRVVKNVAGFDVTRLGIGSWGALGVITSVSARLFPLPEADVTVILEGTDASSLLPQSRAMALSPLPLAAIELLDPPVWNRDGLGGTGALVVRLLGSGEDVGAMEERIRRELRGNGDLRRLEGEESRALHRGLGSWEEGAQLVLRLVALPSLLGDVLRLTGDLDDEWQGLPSRESLQVRVSAHVGAGIVRVAVTGIPTEDGGLEGWIEAVRRLRRVMEGMEGSLTVSSGPAPLVREVGRWGERGSEEVLVRGLKRLFDPQGILVPGRLVG